ncbi:unnamed protein product [Clonostachys rosea f. rosea IK726]|uniref:INO80 complex subunit 4 n=3 Tax=Bionectria ochroleuca TaxID=29856 RepID=A0A8H7NFF2_BIOOC|nr:unnamed protein product [Clonostachys rosea f. rosea IK726]
MAPTAKSNESARRKSGTQKPTMIHTIKVPSKALGDLLSLDTTSDEGTPAQESLEVKSSPASQAAPSAAPTTNGEDASDSNAATPQPEGTPGPATLAPPVEGGKKKGVKRSAAAANGNGDSAPKQRGKPGPKKKPRLEDGTIDHATASNRVAGGHKLGPKANQGAINAGLRALDRSGKPCRKWARGGFTLKSFTGVVWEISRWTAPPKTNPDSATEDSAAPSADNSSGKENKDEVPGVISTANSNIGPDVEMQSAPPSVHASSPAPAAVAAAS